MKCEKCGFKNDKGKNFCTNCGAVLKKKNCFKQKTAYYNLRFGACCFCGNLHRGIFP